MIVYGPGLPYTPTRSSVWCICRLDELRQYVLYSMDCTHTKHTINRPINILLWQVGSSPPELSAWSMNYVVRCVCIYVLSIGATNVETGGDWSPNF